MAEQPKPPSLGVPRLSGPTTPTTTPKIKTAPQITPGTKRAIGGGPVLSKIKTQEPQPTGEGVLGGLTANIKEFGQIVKGAPAGLVQFPLGILKDTGEIVAEAATELLPGVPDYKATTDTIDEMVASMGRTAKVWERIPEYVNNIKEGRPIAAMLVEDAGNLFFVGKALKGIGAGTAAYGAKASATRPGMSERATRIGQKIEQTGDRLVKVSDIAGTAPFYPYLAAGRKAGQFAKTGMYSEKLGGWGEKAATAYQKKINDLIEAEPDIDIQDPRLVELKNKANRAAYRSLSSQARRWIRKAVRYKDYESSIVARELNDVQKNPLYKDDINPDTGEAWGELSQAENEAVISIINGRAQLVNALADQVETTPAVISFLGRYDYNPEYSLSPEGAQLATNFIRNENISPEQYDRISSAVERVAKSAIEFTQRAVRGEGRRKPVTVDYLYPEPIVDFLEKSIYASRNADLIEAFEALRPVWELPVDDPTRINTMMAFMEALPEEISLDPTIYPPNMRENVEYFRRVKRAINRRFMEEMSGEPDSGVPPRGPEDKKMPPSWGRLGAAERYKSKISKGLDSAKKKIEDLNKTIDKVENAWSKADVRIRRFKVVKLYIDGVDPKKIAKTVRLPIAEVEKIIRTNKVAQDYRNLQFVKEQRDRYAEQVADLIDGKDMSQLDLELVTLREQSQRLDDELYEAEQRTLEAAEELERIIEENQLEADSYIEQLDDLEDDLIDAENDYEDAGGDIDEFDQSPEVEVPDTLSDESILALGDQREALLKRIEDLQAQKEELSSVVAPETEAVPYTKDEFIAELRKAGVSDAKIKRAEEAFDTEYKPPTAKNAINTRLRRIFDAATNKKVPGTNRSTNLFVSKVKKNLWWTDGFVAVSSKILDLPEGVDGVGRYSTDATKITDFKSKGLKNVDPSSPALSKVVDDAVMAAGDELTIIGTRPTSTGTAVVLDAGDGQAILVDKTIVDLFAGRDFQILGSQQPKKPVVFVIDGDVVGVAMPLRDGLVPSSITESELIDLIADKENLPIRSVPEKIKATYQAAYDPGIRLTKIDQEIASTQRSVAEIEQQLKDDADARLKQVERQATEAATLEAEPAPRGKAKKETPAQVVRSMEEVKPDEAIRNEAMRKAAYQEQLLQRMAEEESNALAAAQEADTRIIALQRYMDAARRYTNIYERLSAGMDKGTKLIAEQDRRTERLRELRQEKMAEAKAEVREKQRILKSIENSESYAQLQNLSRSHPLRIAVESPGAPQPMGVDVGFFDEDGNFVFTETVETRGPLYIPTGRAEPTAGRLRTDVTREGVLGFQKLSSERRRSGTRETIFSLRGIAVSMSREIAQMTNNQWFRAIIAQFGQTAENILGKEMVDQLWEKAGKDAYAMTPEQIDAIGASVRTEIEADGVSEDGIAAYAPGVPMPERNYELARRQLYGRAIVEQMMLRGYEVVDPFSRIDASVRISSIETKAIPGAEMESMFLPTYLKESIAQVKSTIDPEKWNIYYRGLNKINSAFKTTTLVLSVPWHLGDVITSVVIAQMTGVNVKDMLSKMREVYQQEYGSFGAIFDPSKRPAAKGEFRLAQESPVQDLSLQMSERADLYGIGQAPEKPVGRLRKPFQWITQMSFRFNEFLNRLGRHSYFLNSLEQKLNGMFPDMDGHEALDLVSSDGSWRNDPELRDLIFQVAETSNQWLGDYANLSVWERKQVVGLIPFYSWIKHIHKVFYAIGLEHPQSMRWYTYIGSLAFDPEEDAMGLRQGGVQLFGGVVSTNIFNPLGDVVDGPLVNLLTEKSNRKLLGTLGPVPRMAFGAIGLDITKGGPFLQPPGAGAYTETGMRASGSYLPFAGGSVSETLGFGLQQFPLATRLMNIVPEEIPFTDVGLPRTIPGTRIALGPTQRYPFGEARTKPGTRERLEPPGGVPAALGRLIGLPGIPWRSDETEQDIIRSARARLQTLQVLQARRELLGPP